MPASNADIFKSKDISLKEKRQLARFLKTVTEPTEEDEAARQQYAERPFQAYLESRGLSPNLRTYILHAIVFADVEQGEDLDENQKLLTREGFERMERFLKSLSRFGQTPFLYPLYGTGELGQAFCRYAHCLFCGN